MIDKDAKRRLFDEAMALLDRIEEILDRTEEKFEEATAESYREAA